MSVSKKTLGRVFDKLEVQRSPSNHHIKGFLVENGIKLYPPLHYSKGRGDIPKFVEDKLSKALFLRKEEFHTLCGCKISRDEYFKIRNKRRK